MCTLLKSINNFKNNYYNIYQEGLGIAFAW